MLQEAADDDPADHGGEVQLLQRGVERHLAAAAGPHQQDAGGGPQAEAHRQPLPRARLPLAAEVEPPRLGVRGRGAAAASGPPVPVPGVPRDQTQ